MDFSEAITLSLIWNHIWTQPRAKGDCRVEGESGRSHIFGLFTELHLPYALRKQTMANPRLKPRFPFALFPFRQPPGHFEGHLRSRMRGHAGLM